MVEPNDPSAVLLEHLDWIERIANRVASRYGLSDDEASEFDGWVKLRLVENDYAAVRGFRGESSIRTYLAVVVSRFFIEYRRVTLDRWRPSSVALRLGPLAVRLERLLFFEGHSMSQAIDVLRSSDPDAPEDRELIRLISQLPQRGPVMPAGADVELRLIAPHSVAYEAVQAAEAEQERERLHLALERALATLASEDRAIVRLHFGQGFSLGDVARALGIEQKPLYRRIGHLRAELRELLLKEGVDASMVREALAGYADT